MTEQGRIESIKQNYGSHLRSFKPENLTQAICIAAIEKDAREFEAVPEKFRTKELYTALCRSCGNGLDYVPEPLRTKELCELAIESNGFALVYVPEKHKSKKLCLKAGIKDKAALAFVPDEILTPQFCVEVLRQSNPEAITSLPKRVRSTEFYKAIVEKVPATLKYIPREFRTTELCKLAIKKQGYKTIADAVKDDPEKFLFLHQALYKHDECLEFVKSGFFIRQIRFVPEHGM